MLRDNQIQKLPPGLHSDGGGLYLRVSPKDKRSWVIRSQEGGKDIQQTIGRYPRMTVADARKRRDNPQTLTTDEAIKTYLSKLKVKRPEQVEGLMKAFPSLTANRAELVSILQKKAQTAPTMANRMLTRWKDFLCFCEQQGWIEGNPLAIVQRKYVGGKEESRERVLNWDEISSLLVADAPVLHFILLTGLRPSEAIWVLKHRRTANIPTKTTPHTLPKSHLIQWFLKRKLALPSSHLTLSNRLRRAGATYRPHDLRRTFVTCLNELGVAPYVVEKLVNHKLQGVMAIYNHAEYWPERHAAQRLWDKKLIELLRSPTGARASPSPAEPSTTGTGGGP